MVYLDAFDSRQLRNVLGTFATGVTIVTTRDRSGVPHGVTANSFSSVSLDPPLILWSLALSSKSLEAFTQSEYFAINVLADDQVELSNHFARSQENKFSDIQYSPGIGGVPVLPGTSAHFECRKAATHPGGDHVVYFGQVERIGHSGRRPLAFAHGRYMIPYAHALGPLSLQIGTVPTASVDALRHVTSALPQISAAVGGHAISLSVWGNHGPTVIAWERGSIPASSLLAAGHVLSITATSAGRAFAAFLPRTATSAFIDEDLRLYRVADEDEQTQLQTFESELREIRRTGTARVATATELSAPVFDRAGNMIIALSAIVPETGRSANIDLSHALASAAAALSAAFRV